MPKPVQQEGEDPDPTPYLFVSLEQKRIDQTKPYDAKKACWVPDEKEGYVLGEIKATKGDLVTVSLPGGEVSMSPNNYPPSRKFLCMRHSLVGLDAHDMGFKLSVDKCR
jgi:hypothetical protein